MTKVTIFGCNQMAESITSCLAISETVSEVVIFDDNKDKVAGVVMDFQHGQLFHSTKVVAAESVVDTAFSDVVVVTSGMPFRTDDTAEMKAGKLTKLKAYFTEIVPHIAKLSKDAIVIVVCYPNDAATQYMSQLLKFPPGRVIGSGTFCDTARLKWKVASALGVRPAHVHLHVIGEHNGVEMAAIDNAMCGGSQLTRRLKRDEIVAMHTEVSHGFEQIIKVRGWTSQSIGFTIRHIIHSILADTREVLPLSVNVRGQVPGIDEDTFLSMPVVVGTGGVVKLWQMELGKDERAKLVQAGENVRQTVFRMKAIKAVPKAE
mmetsp:Transcript_17203/g.49925  ORF Transcript_17203/g.49925 Transcript_17203/m.49925 type:complete len:318 (+) Transcript_17203:147-1100(+)